MTEQNDAQKLAKYCDDHLDLANATFANEYRYASLPLCVIDAVWSIGVRYGGVENVITRFCKALNIPRVRPDANLLPPIEQQYGINDFLQLYQENSFDHMANAVYRNHQRTSPRNGILKAEAVYHFANALFELDINYLQDATRIIGNTTFEGLVKQIPGQRSGISINYFYMLVGSTRHIKPDRQVERFVTAVIGRQLSLAEMPLLLATVCETLSPRYPHLNPRLLDNLIWKYQSSK